MCGRGWSVAMVVLIATMCAAAPQQAVAAHGGAVRLVQRDEGGGLISRDRAAEIARAQTGGRVLDVDLRRNGNPWYRVKVLVDGKKVRSVRIDARTGRVLR